MFSRPSYTFSEDDVIGIIEVVISGAILEEAEVIVTGGEITFLPLNVSMRLN